MRKERSTIEDFTSANSLVRSYYCSKRVSGWKESNQKYGLNLLKNTYKIQCQLRNGTYEPDEWHLFKLNEFGKLRVIKAPSVRDTIIQHSLADDCLIPALLPYIIHDNGASLKGKGIGFTRRRFEQHLSWHYRRHGTEGYVLKIDFRKYFDNIEHEKLLKSIKKHVTNSLALKTLKSVLKSNEVDISFTDDEHYIDKVFNSLEYNEIPKELLTGQRYMKKSMGIGSVVSQISGIYYPTPIDTYCKNVLGIHCYDAYMDDRIIIHPNKEYLWKVLDYIRVICKELGLHINERKTQIIKLSHGFTFLKTKYILTNTGKIIRKIPHDVIVRQRKKMKKLANLVECNELSIDEFVRQYYSWKGDKKKYNAVKSLESMDRLFESLLKEVKRYGKENGNFKG